MKNKLDEQERKTVAYYDLDAEWCDRAGNVPSIHESLARDLIPANPLLLDVGCGQGRYVPAFQKVGIGKDQYVGIDPSRSMLEIARQRYPGYDFREIDLYSLPDHFPEGHFNVFAAMMTLMHVTPMKMSRALDSIRAMMSTGSKGFITIRDTDRTVRVVKGVIQDHTYQGPAATFAGCPFERLEPKLTESGFAVRRHILNSDDTYAVLTESV